MRRFTLVLLAVSVCGAGIIGSLGPQWTVVAKARELVEAGRFAEAQDLIDQTWTAARRAGPLHPAYLTTADAVAQFYMGEQYGLKAQAVWTEALAGAQPLGNRHPLQRQLLERAAWQLQYQGQTVKAAALWKQLIESGPEEDAAGRIRALQALASIKESMGVPEEAERLLIEADRLQHFGNQQATQLSRYQFSGSGVGPLAGFLQRRGRSEEAEAIYRQAIDRARQSDSPGLVDSVLRNYSDFLRSERRYDEAAAILRQLIARQSDTNDPRRQDRWLQLQLAHLEREAGRPAEAVRLLADAAARIGRISGDGSPEHQAALTDVLSMKATANSTEGLEELALGILAMPSPTGNQPTYYRETTLQHLLNWYESQSRRDEATRIREQMQDLQRQKQRSDTPPLDLLVQAMHARMASRDFDAAVASAIQALELAAGAPRRSHHQFASIVGIAPQLAYAGRRDDAIALFDRSLAVIERTLPANHPALATQLVQFSNVAGALELGDQAISLLTRAEGILTAANGPDHPSVLNIRRGQIDALRLRGVLGEAVERTRSLLASCQAAQGPGSDTSLSALQLLLELYASQSDWAAAGLTASELQARSAASRGPHGVAHGWLLLSMAQTLGRSSDRSQALALADQAIEVFAARKLTAELENARNVRTSLVGPQSRTNSTRWFHANGPAQ